MVDGGGGRIGAFSNDGGGGGSVTGGEDGWDDNDNDPNMSMEGDGDGDGDGGGSNDRTGGGTKSGNEGKSGGGEEDQKNKKKRNRPILSCTECKRRKIKCDRRIPCEGCVKRGMPALCRWDEPGRQAPQPWALNTEMHGLADRLAHLETLFARLPPEVLSSVVGNELQQHTQSIPSQPQGPSQPAGPGFFNNANDIGGKAPMGGLGGSTTVGSATSYLSPPAIAARKARLFPGGPMTEISSTASRDERNGSNSLLAGTEGLKKFSGTGGLGIERPFGIIPQNGKPPPEINSEEEVDLDELGLWKISSMFRPRQSASVFGAANSASPAASPDSQPLGTRSSSAASTSHLRFPGLGLGSSSSDGPSQGGDEPSKPKRRWKPPDSFPDPKEGENSTIFLDPEAQLPTILDCDPLTDPATYRSQILKSFATCLPDKPVADFLTQSYLKNLDWALKSLHAPSFKQEYETFWAYRGRDPKGGGSSDIGWLEKLDPLWLGILFMTLCLALDAAGQDAQIPWPLNTLDNEKLRILPVVWFRCALHCLKLADYTGIPRIRSVQIILLFLPFLHTSGYSGGGFMVWMAGAIRICQMLGLHRLGSDPTLMPPPDPAYPSNRPNSLARELSKRLWNTACGLENLHCQSTRGASAINMSQVTTDFPMNINDHELLPDGINDPKPERVWTTATYEIYRTRLGFLLRQLYDSISGEEALNYNKILQFDEAFHSILESVDWVSMPNIDAESDDPTIAWCRNLGQQGSHFRLMRLHHPFLARYYAGFTHFEYSAKACVRSARIIVAAQKNLLNAPTGYFWFPYHHALNACIVLFQDLWHSIDNETSTTREDVNESFQYLVGSLEVFKRGMKINSPLINNLARQGLLILEQLYQRARDRRSSRACGEPETEPFAITVRSIVEARRSAFDGSNTPITAPALNSNHPATAAGSRESTGSGPTPPQTGTGSERNRPSSSAQPQFSWLNEGKTSNVSFSAQDSAQNCAYRDLSANGSNHCASAFPLGSTSSTGAGEERQRCDAGMDVDSTAVASQAYVAQALSNLGFWGLDGEMMFR